MRILIGAMLLILLCGAHAAGAQERDELPELNNYAWGFPVEIEALASFYTLPLPFDVYEVASDAGLRDLSVYNAAGKAVPRVIEAGRDDVSASESLTSLPFAALFRDREADPDALRLVFERMGGGTRIDLQSEGSGNDEPGNEGEREKIRPPLTAYVVDARRLDGEIDALEIAWPDELPGFIGQVIVEGSDDLESWYGLGGGALADLREQAADIRRDRLDITRSGHDFLKLSWRNLPPDWRAVDISAVQRSETVSVLRRLRQLNAIEYDEERNAWQYKLAAPVRVDRAGLMLSADNNVIEASIQFRAPETEHWQPAHRGTFYRLRNDDSRVNSEPVAIPAVRSSEWRVMVHGGNPDAAPVLTLGWRPDTLLFVAQGTGPFTVAVGRPGAADEGFPENRLLGEVSLGGIATDNGPVAEAALGDRFPLGGVVREPAPEPLPWRTVILWSVLLLAVLFVLWMAWRILRTAGED